MATDYLNKAFTDRSNARAAAKKHLGLEPAEFTVKQEADGKWHIRLIEGLKPAAYAAEAPAQPATGPAHNTPADQGMAAARADDESPLPCQAELDDLKPAPAAKVLPFKPAAAAACEEAALATKLKIELARKAKAPAPKPNPAAQHPADLEEAAKIFTINRVSARHLEALSNARQGTMPSEPDLSNENYASYRNRYLPKMRELIAARDADGLAAFTATIDPKFTSTKMLFAFGKLAEIALRSRSPW